MKVLKFGGSSVKNAERLRNVAQIVKKSIEETGDIVVVVSAFGGVTNRLVEMSQLACAGDQDYQKKHQLFNDHCVGIVEELFEDQQSIAGLKLFLADQLEELREFLHGVFLVRELTLRTKDLIMSFGERISAKVVAEFLSLVGSAAEVLDAREVIVTDDNFGAARVKFDQTNRNIVQRIDAADKLQVVTGFIGATESKVTTTLGRDGSDYTASVFGAALKADVIEIWTDVDGVMTCDPRKVKQAFSVARMTYEEAMEMSHFGAEVIHPPTIQPALKNGVPIYIKNSLNPSFPGTRINGETSMAEDYIVKGITSIDEISLLRFQGAILIERNTQIYERLFKAFSKANINLVMICQASSERSICFALPPEEARIAQKYLDEEFQVELKLGDLDPVIVEEDLAVVAIVGANMKNTPGVAARLFTSLADNNVSAVAIAQGSSELNVSVVINRSDEVKALNAIHETFFFNA